MILAWVFINIFLRRKANIFALLATFFSRMEYVVLAKHHGRLRHLPQTKKTYKKEEYNDCWLNEEKIIELFVRHATLAHFITVFDPRKNQRGMKFLWQSKLFSTFPFFGVQTERFQKGCQPFVRYRITRSVWHIFSCPNKEMFRTAEVSFYCRKGVAELQLPFLGKDFC